MALVSRELSITYGGVTIGKGTNYIIDGKFTHSKDWNKVRVSCDVIAWDTTEAAFATTCATLESAFRLPRSSLTIKFNSTTQNSYDPANNSGFNANPSIEKAGSPHDTGRSRRYKVAVEMELPADLATQPGRRSSSINLMTTESGRRRLTVSGLYTAYTSSAARAQYNANISSYIASITSAFGGTWEGPFDQSEVSDDTNKNISFTTTYEELIFNQSSGVLDDPNIRRQHLKVSRSVEAVGDSIILGTVRRAEILTVDYDAAIDKTVTQDLKTTFETIILPFVIATAKTATGATGAALIGMDPVYDYVENRISASVRILVLNGSNILSASVKTEDAIDYGRDLVAVWSGDRQAKYAFVGPGRITRTISYQSKELNVAGNNGGAIGTPPSGSAGSIGGVNLPASQNGGGGGSDNAGGGVAQAPGSIGQAGFAGPSGGSDGDTLPASPRTSPDGGSLSGVLMSVTAGSVPIVMGLPGYDQLHIIDRYRVETWEFVVKPPAAKKTDAPTPPSTTGAGGIGSGLGGGPQQTGGASNPPRVATGVN